MKLMFFRTRSRLFTRLVLIACSVVVFMTTACALRFYYLNETEKQFVGYWELVEKGDEPVDQAVFLRFVSNREIHWIDSKTGRESSGGGYWFANATDFWGFAPPKWKTLHRLPYDLIQLQKRQREGGARIKILEVTESTLVLHNVSSENGPANFRRREPEEIQEIIAANRLENKRSATKSDK